MTTYNVTRNCGVLFAFGFAAIAGLTMPGCSDDGVANDTSDTDTSGDGDGDGDPTTGDGDGDPTTGDGDGDPTTGDGDGDPATGDGDGDEPDIDDELRDLLAAQNVEPVPLPAPPDEAMFELGRLLFFDKELSGPRTIACSTCHHPLLGSADAQGQSKGQGAIGLGPLRLHSGPSLFLPRSALSIWNRGVEGWDTMFWDGRLGFDTEDETFFSPAGEATPQGFDNALAAFTIIPVTPDREMRGFPEQLDIYGEVNEFAELSDADFEDIWAGVVARVMALDAYVGMIEDAFPDVAPEDVDITHISNAIGAFEGEAFLALDSPFDRYLAGDNDALPGAAKRGALLFYGEANCSSCHSGALQSDFGFHNIAAPQVGTGNDTGPLTGDEPEAPLDIGRARVTGEDSERFQFRTPSLRNILLEGPWLHNGAYADIEGVINHHLDPTAALESYDDSQLDPELVGSRAEVLAAVPDIDAQLLDVLDPLLIPMDLSPAQLNDLLAFLNALVDPDSLNQLDLVPASVPSGIPVDD